MEAVPQGGKELVRVSLGIKLLRVKCDISCHGIFALFADRERAFLCTYGAVKTAENIDFSIVLCHNKKPGIDRVYEDVFAKADDAMYNNKEESKTTTF